MNDHETVGPAKMEVAMTEASLFVLLSMLDRALTAIFSAIKAIQTESAEVQAKKDALIARMKTLEDFTDPMVEE